MSSPLHFHYVFKSVVSKICHKRLDLLLIFGSPRQASSVDPGGLTARAICQMASAPQKVPQPRHEALCSRRPVCPSIGQRWRPTCPSQAFPTIRISAKLSYRRSIDAGWSWLRLKGCSFPTIMFPGEALPDCRIHVSPNPTQQKSQRQPNAISPAANPGRLFR